MRVEFIPESEAPPPNIMPELLRSAVTEIMAEKGIDLESVARLIPTDPGDLQFWLSHQDLDRPWFRTINREVERFAAQHHDDCWHTNRNARTCGRCRRLLPQSDFYASHTWCKACIRAYAKTRKAAKTRQAMPA
jgi:hypothetical protein